MRQTRRQKDKQIQVRDRAEETPKETARRGRDNTNIKRDRKETEKSGDKHKIK